MLHGNRRVLARILVQFVTAARGTALESQVTHICNRMDHIRDALHINHDDLVDIMLCLTYTVRQGRLDADVLSRLRAHLPELLDCSAAALRMEPEAFLQQVNAGQMTVERFLPAFVDAYAAMYAPDEVSGMTIEEFQAWSDQIIREYRDSE